MNKRKKIGLVMLIFGVVYMICSFSFTNFFEQLNDTLCFILTIISVVCIIWWFGILVFKTLEEHFKEQAIKNEDKIKLNKYYKYKPIITYILIAINVLMFVLINMFYGNNEVLRYAISKNSFEFNKLLISMFVHVDAIHLIFNMLAFYICGSKLESLIGNFKYSVVYMLSGLGASILIVLLSNNPCAGASGAIFGLFGCYLLIAFKNKNVMKYTYKYDLLPSIVINLIVTFVMPNISIIAHVGGLIIGIVCSQIMCRNIKVK